MNRLIARNLVWNKTYTDQLPSSQSNHYLELAEQLNSQLNKEDPRIRYSIFAIERGSRQNNLSFHFQGYIEFKKTVEFHSFNKDFSFTDLQVRKGTQRQAIDYVKKGQSKLVEKLFEFGSPKRQTTPYNILDADIPKEHSRQELEINQRLKEGYYSSFEDIEKDFERIFIKQNRWLKDLWNRYHPVEVLDEVPARTIWIYGVSSSGKTTWTKEYFRKRGISSAQICKKKASNSKRPKLWFELEDDFKEILWIEEIRENFPDFNDVIQLIDKGTRLEVKGSHVNNNFKLIIFNSLFSPDKVYNELPSSHQVEILRRLYEGKVYLLIKNQNPEKDGYNKLVDLSASIPNVLAEHLSKGQVSSPKIKPFLSRLKSLFTGKG